MNRTTRRRFLATILAVALGLIVGAEALAASKGSADIVLSDTSPAYGDQLTVSASDVVRYHDDPYAGILIRCERDGSLIYATTILWFRDDADSRTFTLASQTWTGGAASCVAGVYSTTEGTRLHELAAVAFEVSA